MLADERFSKGVFLSSLCRLFLLRVSQSNPKAFVLTLCHHQKIKHFQILPVGISCVFLKSKCQQRILNIYSVPLIIFVSSLSPLKGGKSNPKCTKKRIRFSNLHSPPLIPPPPHLCMCVIVRVFVCVLSSLVRITRIVLGPDYPHPQV